MADTLGEAGLKNSILQRLQIEIEQQKNRLELAEALEAIDSSSETQDPSIRQLDLLLRYRAANTREFNGLLDSLERIRRLRRSAT